MVSIAVLTTLAGVWSFAVGVAMQRGFAGRDPAIVASAYHDETAIGGVYPPRIRTEEELPSLFGYVAPKDESVLALCGYHGAKIGP